MPVLFWACMKWDSEEHKFLFDSSEPLYLAGFYRNAFYLPAVRKMNPLVCDQAPCTRLQPIHDRMPVFDWSKADVLAYGITDVTFRKNYLLKRCPDFTHNCSRKPKRRQTSCFCPTAFFSELRLNKHKGPSCHDTKKLIFQ